MSTKKSPPAAKRPSKKRTTKTARGKGIGGRGQGIGKIAEALLGLAVPIDQVEPDPRNARTHSEQNVAAIAASLKRFGQRRPLVANRRNGQIEAGHGLLEAAKTLGWTELAVVWVDDDPRAQSGFSIADNRTAELAEWDNDRLAILLADLRNDDQFDELSCALLLANLEKDQHGATEETESVSFEAAPNQTVPEAYAVVVVCADERDQKAFYDRIQAEGRKCRLLTT